MIRFKIVPGKSHHGRIHEIADKQALRCSKGQIDSVSTKNIMKNLFAYGSFQNYVKVCVKNTPTVPTKKNN